MNRMSFFSCATSCYLRLMRLVRLPVGAFSILPGFISSIRAFILTPFTRNLHPPSPSPPAAFVLRRPPPSHPPDPATGGRPARYAKRQAFSASMIHGFASFPSSWNLRGSCPMYCDNSFRTRFVSLVATVDGEAEPVSVQLVSGDLFSTFQVDAVLGRTLLPSDDAVARGGPVVVISDSYWEQRFARSSAVISKMIELNRTREPLSESPRQVLLGGNLVGNRDVHAFEHVMDCDDRPTCTNGSRLRMKKYLVVV